MNGDLVIAALSRLEAGQMSLLADVASLKTDVASLKTDVASLKTDVASLKTGFASMQESQTSIRVEVMARMDRLQNSLTAIRDDITVNMARSDRAHDGVSATRDELRLLGQEVAISTRKLRQLEERVRSITGDP